MAAPLFKVNHFVEQRTCPEAARPAKFIADVNAERVFLASFWTVNAAIPESMSEAFNGCKGYADGRRKFARKKEFIVDLEKLDQVLVCSSLGPLH